MATPSGPIHFFNPTTITDGRYSSLYTKEPETIDWINGFQDGDALWDIGANVGIYSIYANKMKNCRVLAFEPAADNYAVLCKNINLNAMHDVWALNVALCAKTRIDHLNLQNETAGAALSAFGRMTDQMGRQFDAVAKQTVLGFSGDDLRRTFDLECPDHIKLDVDGIEEEVIEGLQETLRNPRLKSLSVELSEEVESQFLPVLRILTECGFRQEWKRHAAMFDGHEFGSFYNYLFIR